MSEDDWGSWFAKSFIVFLNGEMTSRDRRNRPVHDDSFCLLFNAHGEGVSFTVPGDPWGKRWSVTLDTGRDDPFPESPIEYDAGAQIDCTGLSLVVLRRLTR
jgi:glycogen operon protein